MQTLTQKAGDVQEAFTELIAQARSGSHSAFEEIYRIHVGRVYAICLRVLADRSWAEEATQQIFIRVWMKLRSFRGQGSFGSWLYRVCLNIVLNELKAAESRNRHMSAGKDPPLDVISRPGRSLNTRLELETAIAALPAQARAVFVLHDVEGFKHEEIAKELGIAVGTCKAQLSRARKLLREALNQ